MSSLLNKCLELQLSPNQKLVLLVLACYADHSGNNAYPKTKTLSVKTGLSKRTVERILKQLRDLQVVHPTSRPGKSTNYKITPESTPATAMTHVPNVYKVYSASIPDNTAKREPPNLDKPLIKSDETKTKQKSQQPTTITLQKFKDYGQFFPLPDDPSLPQI